jgi:lipopolysaccharide biosynthesis regulator YciM
MRKIFYSFVFVACILTCLILSELHSDIVIRLHNYEIITNSSFIILNFVLVFLLFANIISSYYIIKETNKNKYLKMQEVYKRYINLICEGFLYNFNNDIKSAERKNKQAEKTIKNCDLTKILKGQILLNKQKYQESINVIKTIKNDKITNLYFIDNILLTQAINQCDEVNVKLCGERILERDKNNNLAVKTLYEIYRNELNWIECAKLLKIIKKYKIFSETKIKNENKLIGINLQQFK